MAVVHCHQPYKLAAPAAWWLQPHTIGVLVAFLLVTGLTAHHARSGTFSLGTAVFLLTEAWGDGFIQDGNRTGPWRRNRPQMNITEHPNAGPFSTNCALINCRKDAVTCPASDRTCCSFWIRGLLEFLGWQFEQHQQRYMIAFGTLLGAYRDGVVLPWDKDADLLVDTQLWNLLNSPNNVTNDTTLQQEAWQYGFILRPMSGNYIIAKACYHVHHPDFLAGEAEEWPAPGKLTRPEKAKEVFVDMFEARAEGGGDRHRFHSGEPGNGEHDTFANATFTHLYNISGLWLRGVDDVEGHLMQYYGPQWSTPIVDMW